MRILQSLTLLLLLAATSLFAQQKKYQGLLWEVSGNGLKKNSYLYGSMHVSDKVSYHLSDAFYTHLLAADLVANESEPSTWMNLMGFVGNELNRNNSNKLYAGFFMEPATKQSLYPLFRSNNYTINNLLFRTNEVQKDYQEETYLDMFIYRTGRKYHKKTVGLEDTKTSLLNIMNIDTRDSKPREENIVALQKILKNTGYQQALLNYYRDKDLDMLDSLTTLASSESYLKTLLYDRNVAMVHSIDSLVKTGSLFAAVGAAHLPGRRGIIEMLRGKGYTVNPVKDSYTDSGRINKEKIEDYFIQPTFTKYTTADAMVSLPVFNGPVIETQQNLQSPDLANGGYINVKRLLLKDFLKKDNKPFNRLTLDSLFYENIPGKILDKKFYTQDGYSIYDIKNITKTGNAQRYRYYISPLEVIVVSMAGEKNYVRQFENEVYNSITLKPITNTWTVASPKKGGFNVQLPAYRALYGETEKLKMVQDAALYAYDPGDKANYFVIERTLHENETLEDSNFELERIHYEFYNNLGIDSTQTNLYRDAAVFTSVSSIGNKPIRLKSIIKGSKYYLLGSVGATAANNDKFTKSFTSTPYTIAENYRIFKDTTAHYSISIPIAENEKLDFETKYSVGNYIDPDDKNVFQEKYSTRQFVIPSGQSIDVFYQQYHRHRTIKSVDSLWANMKRYITDEKNSDDADDEDDAVATVDAYDTIESGKTSVWDKIMDKKSRKITLVNVKQQHVTDGDYDTFEAMAVATNSAQAIKFKAFYHNGTSYIINTIVDKNYKGDDPALEKTFNSFTLLDDPKAETLPANRLQLFIDDARSEHDSIRSSALQSVRQLRITKDDRTTFEKFIESFDFKDDETDALVTLYGKLGRLKDEASIPFFEKQYKIEGSTTVTQFAILQALAEFESKAAYKKIQALMEYDLPVSDDSYEVTKLFQQFSRNTKNSAVLFPDVLQYYSIPEYHEPIVAFAARLLEDDAIKPKKLKSYKKMLLTNARLEVKRAKSRKANQSADEGEYYDEDAKTSNLKNYIELLYPFKNDKAVATVLESIKKLDDKEANLAIATLDIKNGNASKDEINQLLSNPVTLFDIQRILTEQKETAWLKNVTDEQIAKSALVTLTSANPKTDSITFVEKRIVKQGKNSVSFYFYKIKNTNTDNNYGYGRSADKLSAIAFVNNADRIMPQAYKNAGTKRLTGNDQLKDLQKAIIDATLNENKRRATFGNKATGYDIDDLDSFEEPEY